MNEALLSRLLAGYGVALPLGAIGMLIAGLAARTSLAVGASAGMGAATADGLYALLAVLGGAALARVIQPIATPLRVVAAAVLVAIAVHAAAGAIHHYRSPRAAGAARHRPWHPAARVPRRARAHLAEPGHRRLRQGARDRPAGSRIACRGRGDGLVGAVFVASASWQLLLASSGSLVGRVLTGRRGRLLTTLVSSAVIGVLALSLLLAE